MAHDIGRATVAYSIQRSVLRSPSCSWELLRSSCPGSDDSTGGIRRNKRKPDGGHIGRGCSVGKVDAPRMGG